jgi:hypothetical protein
MTEINGIYAIFLLISIGIILYLTYYSWNKRSDSNTNYFSFFIFTVSKWMIIGDLEMTLFTKVLWSQFTYLGIVVVETFWLFSLIYKATDQGLRIIQHLTEQIEGNNKLDRINGTNYYWFKQENYGDDS